MKKSHKSGLINAVLTALPLTVFSLFGAAENTNAQEITVTKTNPRTITLNGKSTTIKFLGRTAESPLPEYKMLVEVGGKLEIFYDTPADKDTVKFETLDGVVGSTTQNGFYFTPTAVRDRTNPLPDNEFTFRTDNANAYIMGDSIKVTNVDSFNDSLALSVNNDNGKKKWAKVGQTVKFPSSLGDSTEVTPRIVFANVDGANYYFVIDVTNPRYKNATVGETENLSLKGKTVNATVGAYDANTQRYLITTSKGKYSGKAGETLNIDGILTALEKTQTGIGLKLLDTASVQNDTGLFDIDTLGAKYTDSAGNEYTLSKIDGDVATISVKRPGLAKSAASEIEIKQGQEINLSNGAKMKAKTVYGGLDKDGKPVYYFEAIYSQPTGVNTERIFPRTNNSQNQSPERIFDARGRFMGYNDGKNDGKFNRGKINQKYANGVFFSKQNNNLPAKKFMHRN